MEILVEKDVHEGNNGLLKVKRYQDWQDDLGTFLQIGDLVDQEFVNYFIDVLPPACMNGKCVQIGEPYSHREDKNGKWRATFPTLKKTPEGWRYAGHCFRGETENVD